MASSESSCQIFLENFNGSYYPGQTIIGRVECNFISEKKIRDITVKLKGQAETSWIEHERYYDHHQKKHRTRSVRYSGEETYFNSKHSLIQVGSGETIIPIGKYSYPFSFVLPMELPSSLEEEEGSIRYTIKAVVDRPWKFDYEAKVAFSIISLLDLNFPPGLNQPGRTEVDKELCCWCCASGPLTFNVSIPALGFTPGQTIEVSARVENLSNVSSPGTQFKLEKTVTFRTTSPRERTKEFEHAVQVVRDTGIGAHGEHSWVAKLIIPPNMFVPNLRNCSLIQERFLLKAKVELPCPHSDLTTQIPVTLGTIPLATQYLNAAAPSQINAYFDNPSQSSAAISPLNSVSGPYPPSGLNASYPYPPEKSPSAPPIIGGTAPVEKPGYPSAPGVTQYPQPGGSSYPAGGASESIQYPYPGATSYPHPGGTSYPHPGGTSYPPAGPPYPSNENQTNSEAPPPSYQEFLQMKQGDKEG